MNEIDDDMISVGDPLPTIASVAKATGPFDLVIVWASGSRKGQTDVLDAAAQIQTFKVYRPLREDSELFARVAVSDDGTAVVWPGSADLEISADALEELVEQQMTNEAFAAFINRQGWTLDAASAQLGISRRLVAYYMKEREIPRLVALACRSFEGYSGKPGGVRL